MRSEMSLQETEEPKSKHHSGIERIGKWLGGMSESFGETARNVGKKGRRFLLWSMIAAEAFTAAGCSRKYFVTPDAKLATTQKMSMEDLERYQRVLTQTAETSADTTLTRTIAEVLRRGNAEELRALTLFILGKQGKGHVEGDINADEDGDGSGGQGSSQSDVNKARKRQGQIQRFWDK